MRRVLLFGLLLTLIACAPDAPERVSLALVPPTALEGEIDAELAIEGLSALLLARLRALPEIEVGIDAAGCAGRQQPTHSLEVARELTATSALTRVTLSQCDSDHSVIEQWVQPRQARRDWSALAAWWVGGELRVPRPKPAAGPALEEVEMQSFLVAIAQIKRRTANDVDAARQRLLAIVQQRPDFALAQAHLATAHLLAVEYGLSPLAPALEQADAAIEAALQAAPDLGMAHAARGLYWMNQERYDLAVPQLARAAALDPGEGVVLLWLGNALLYHGRPREAEPWLERALMLDPALVSAEISLGEAACLSGREKQCNRFLQGQSAGPMAAFMAALISAHRGEIKQSLAWLAQVPDDVNRDWVVDLRGDLCRLQLAPTDDCDSATDRIAPTDNQSLHSSQPKPPGHSAGDPPSADLDLWKLDLGLGQWVQSARRDQGDRQQLEREIQRLRDGGLALPLLADIEYCLQQWQTPELPPRRSLMAAMLLRWGCAAETPEQK